MSIDVIVATPSLDTVRAVHAALDDRRPLALLHPRATADEQTRQRDALRVATFERDDALALFTSGSTAAARGVVLSRAAIEAAATASAAHLGWRDDDRWLVCLPLSHAGGLSIVVRCYLAGKPIVLAEPRAIASPGLPGRAANAERLRSMIDDVTLASLVPSQLAALLEDPRWRPSLGLRAVLLGGAAAPPSLVAEAVARGMRVLPTYGLTETFGQVATARMPGGPLVPLAGVDLTAGTHDTPAPIRIRGSMLATRYLDGAPIAPELVTADLGLIEDGALVVVGRRDDVIVTGGENVHPSAVEAVLAATPGVRAAAVFGVADSRWGQLVAAATAVDASFDLRRAVQCWHERLPPFARPRRLALVRDLPHLPSGKIDRRRLATLPTHSIDYT